MMEVRSRCVGTYEGIVALGKLGNLIDERANLARGRPARVGVRAVNPAITI